MGALFKSTVFALVICGISSCKKSPAPANSVPPHEEKAATKGLADGYAAAIQAFQRNDMARAEALIRDALTAGAPSAEGRNLLGMVLGQQGRYDEAIELFRENAAATPNSGQAYFNWAEALRRAGRSSEALDPLIKANSLKPGDSYYHLKLGLCRVENGDAEFEKTIAKQIEEPTPAPEWELLAAASALRKGQSKEATTRLSLAQQAMPAEFFNECLRDPSFSHYKNLKEMASFYPNGPSQPTIGSNLKEGMSAYAAGDWEKALSLTVKAQEAGESPEAIYNLRGAIFMAQKNYSEATTAFAKAVKETPHDASPHFNLGEALRAEGRNDEALAALATASELQPDSAIYAIKLRLAKIKAGHASEVSKEIDSSLRETHPQGLEILLAALAIERNDLSEAAKQLAIARKSTPSGVFGVLIQDPIFQNPSIEAALKALPNEGSPR